MSFGIVPGCDRCTDGLTDGHFGDSKLCWPPEKVKRIVLTFSVP